jgi:hypothetical protein
MWLLFIAENEKELHYGSLQWHNVQTKFHETR